MVAVLDGVFATWREAAGDGPICSVGVRDEGVEQL
jgi:hypothetical protein